MYLSIGQQVQGSRLFARGRQMMFTSPSSSLVPPILFKHLSPTLRALLPNAIITGLFVDANAEVLSRETPAVG
jgi:hypothetical protein